MVQNVRVRTRKEPEVRRDQILNEAISLVGQRGFGFTVQELAGRCGLTNGGLLHYFGSKEELLVAVLEERDRREACAVRAVAGPKAASAARDNSSRNAVLTIFRAIVVRAVEAPELARFDAILQSESIDAAHPAHDYYRKREAVLLDGFAQMVAPHVAEPASTARHLLALMDGLGHQWLRARRAFDLVAEWDRVVALLLPEPGHPTRNGFHADPPAS